MSNKKEVATFAENLRKCMKEKDISLQRLSRHTKLDYSSLHRHYSGTTKGIQFHVLGPVCRALGTSPNDLIPWESS